MGDERQEQPSFESEADKIADASIKAHNALDRSREEPVDAGWAKIGEMAEQASATQKAQQAVTKAQMDKALGLTGDAEDEEDEELLQLDGLHKLMKMGDE